MSIPLAALTRWYAAHCDGRWEHHHGIAIRSLDNPGWWLTVDVKGTPLEHLMFTPVADGVDPEGHPKSKSWIACSVKNGTWHGAGDETRLDEIIRRFLDWATPGRAR